VLAERPWALVCDETQWLSRECFEFWSSNVGTTRVPTSPSRWSAVGPCYPGVLKREPPLPSRVYMWREFRRPTREQVLKVIPVYHPVWAVVDADLNAYADTDAGHGNFRA